MRCSLTCPIWSYPTSHWLRAHFLSSSASGVTPVILLLGVVAVEEEGDLTSFGDITPSLADLSELLSRDMSVVFRCLGRGILDKVKVVDETPSCSFADLGKVCVGKDICIFEKECYDLSRSQI